LQLIYINNPLGGDGGGIGGVKVIYEIKYLGHLVINIFAELKEKVLVDGNTSSLT
jgi:hypothetical protein